MVLWTNLVISRGRWVSVWWLLDAESSKKFFFFTGEVIYNHTDIAINSRFIKSYGADEEISFLSPVFSDRLCIITPKAMMIPRWKAPLLIFTPLAWAGIFFMILFSSIFLFIMRQWEDL